MEQGGMLTLENHANAAQGHAEVQSKLREHAEATRRHADLVAGCIERLGGRPSVLKEAIGTVMGKVQGVANLPAKDTVVKNALGDLAAENFEIASYRSLIAAAEQVGDNETADVCRQILDDEEEMAGWLAAQIPAITRQFLAEQTGEESQGVQAQVMDKATQAVKGLGEQSKGLSSKAKQTGQDVQAQIVEKAKRLADELEEQGEELAEKAKQMGKDALVTSGALLVGAGVGLLALQALRSRSGEKRRAPDHDDESDAVKDAHNAVRIDHDAAYGGAGGVGLSAEPVLGLDLQTETLDLSEAFVQSAERSTVPEPQPEEQLGDMSGRIAEPPVVPGFQSQEQTMGDPLSLDADVSSTELIGSDVQVSDNALSADADPIDAASMGGDVQALNDSLDSDADVMDTALMRSDVRNVGDASVLDADLVDAEDVLDVDGLLSPDADLIDARLMDNYPGDADEVSSLDTNLTDVELADSGTQDLNELSSLDADSREAELMSSDAQSDVQDVSELTYTEVWLVPGPYSGAGPIGYDNSGNPTGQEVYSRLTQHGQVDASNIESTIDNSEVLFEGTVDSEEAKRLAEEAVETVMGVSSVQNLLPGVGHPKVDDSRPRQPLPCC
jgi:ferritin-like metal-binding protein YciE